MSEEGDDWDNFSAESSSEEEDSDMAEEWSKEVDQIKGYDGVVSIRAIKPGVIRAGAEPTSDQLGKLEVGEVFSILEECEVDGKKRVRMERGWISLTSKKGTPLCVSEVAVQKLLSSVPILQELTEQDRAGIASLLEGQEFMNQEVIMREGEAGNHMYFLEQGEAVAKRGTKAVKLYGSGDYFGELALLTGTPRQATVIAQGADGARCLKLSRENFDKYASTCKAVMHQRAAYAQDSDSSEYLSDSADETSGTSSASESDAEEDDAQARAAQEKKAVQDKLKAQRTQAAEESAAKLKADQEKRQAEREALAKKREEESAARQKQQAEMAAKRKAEREERAAKAQAEREEREAQAAKRREEQAKRREEEAAERQKRQAEAAEAAAAKKQANEEAKAKARAEAVAKRAADEEAKAKKEAEAEEKKAAEAKAKAEAAAAAATEEKKAAETKAKADAAAAAAAEEKKVADEKAKAEAEAAAAAAAAAAKKAADEKAKAEAEAAAAAAAKKAADEKAKANEEAAAAAAAAVEKAAAEKATAEADAKKAADERAKAQEEEAAAKKAADEKAKAEEEAAAVAAAAGTKAAEEKEKARASAPQPESEPEPETNPLETKRAKQGERQTQEASGRITMEGRIAAPEVERMNHSPNSSFDSRGATAVHRDSTPPASPLAFNAPRTISAKRLLELDERLEGLQRAADERRQARLQLDEQRLKLSESQMLFLSPRREEVAVITADGDLSGFEQDGTNSEVAEFDVDEQDTEEEDELTKVEQDLRSTCTSYWCYVIARLIAIIICSALLSLLPVMFNFSDPYDLTQEGIANNLGYFLGYNSVSWSAFFFTLSLWMHRILAVRLNIFGTVVLPTLFAMTFFFGGTLVLGAPVPLATFTLGAPCLLVTHAALRCFMTSSPKEEEEEEGEEEEEEDLRAVADRLLNAFAMWTGQMILYAVLTVAMISGWPHDVLISIVVALGLEFIGLADGEATLFRRPGSGTYDSLDQRNCARLLPILPLSIHVSFTQFLFPVLGSTDSVVCNAMITAAMNVYVLRVGLPTLRADNFRGELPARSYAMFLSRRFIYALVQLVCPVVFMIVLAFTVWGPNAGMFYILSEEELHEKNGEDGVTKVIFACGINIFTSLLSTCLSIWVVLGWLKRNSHNGHDEAEISHAIPDSDDMDHDTDHMADVDISRYTSLRALQIAQEYTVNALQHNSTIIPALCGTYPARDKQPYAAVRAKDEDEETGDGTADNEEAVVAAREEAPGQLDLIIASLACSMAMCSVCMLLKHNGMAVEGWFKWITGNDMPYALCPGLSFESPCLARNVSLNWELP